MPTAALETAFCPLSALPANGSTPRVLPTYHRFDPSRVVGTMSVDEWDTFARAAKHKYHYVYGEVVQMVGASPEHNLLSMNFAVSLRNALDAVETPCAVLGSDQRVSGRENLYYFPDLLVVCGKMRIDPRDALQNPAAVIEVLSPTTESDDRGDKFREYQQIESLQHYLLIDQNRVCVTHYEKMDGGLWAIRGDYRALSDALTLTLAETAVTVPLARIYRNVPLPKLADD